jgi:hypothetical protein
MKILNFILAAMFLLFAFVQVNDPDPLIWILIYGAMAVMAVMAMFNVFIRNAILLLLVIYIAYSLVYLGGVQEWLQQQDKSLLLDDVAKMQYPYIEETREFLGLWICIIVLIFYYIRSRSFQRKTLPSKVQKER